MLVAVLVLFVVTWLPNLVMDILYYTKIGNSQINHLQRTMAHVAYP